MSAKLELVRINLADIKHLVVQFKGLSIALFGSVARGEEHPDSDIDFLVEFKKDASLLDQAGLQLALTELLNAPVDVISLGGLKSRDHHILEEAIYL